jgi:hypothetical protein
MISLRAGRADVDRPVLYAVYGTDISVRLARIYSHPERDGPHGTLTVALHGRRSAHIQCRFVDDGAALLCEAMPSGSPLNSDDAVPVAADVEAGLRKVGYWRDKSGRALFRHEITPDSAVWGGAAVTILAPLIDVFGARAASKIEVIAPLAPERDEAAIRRELS